MKDIANKIKLLEFRLHCLKVNGRENDGVCRKINRQIRGLKEVLAKSE